MTEPKLQIEQRLDRIELAIVTMAEQLGTDPEEINKILRGETSKEKEDAST